MPLQHSDETPPAHGFSARTLFAGAMCIVWDLTLPLSLLLLLLLLLPLLFQ